MEPEGIWQIALLLLLVFFSALFSAAEAAFRSISPLKLNQLFDEGNEKLASGVKLMKSPEKLRGVLMVGDSIFNISAVALLTIYMLEGHFTVYPVLTLILMGILLIIVGEIIPKSIGSLYPIFMIQRLSFIITVLSIVFNPLILIMLWINRIFLLLIGGDPDSSKPFITEEELMSYVNASHEDGVLEVEEKKMIYNVVEFGDIEVSQIMTPRTDIISAPLDADYETLYELFKHEQASRIPIYEDNIDQIVGILNIKRWMFFEGDKSTYQVSEHMRQPFFTYESKKTADLFNEMRQSKHQMAIVLDEYGGTAGLVTLEDLIEEIVGDIDDEFDDGVSEISTVAPDVYLIQGSTHLSDVNDALGLNLLSEDFDSIGGYIIGILGRLPESGEELSHENLLIQVLEVEKNRIGQVQIHIINAEPENETPESID